jgi:hypothetical protein
MTGAALLTPRAVAAGCGGNTAESAPPPVPEDVKGPPEAASRTAGGLAYRMLVTKDAGVEQPGEGSRGLVHYSVWTLDGRLLRRRARGCRRAR